MRQIVNPNGEINFIGVMSKSEDQPEFIIIDPNFHLSAISSNCINIFQASGFESDASSDAFIQRLRQVHISEWISDWKENEHHYRKEQGCSVSLHNHQVHIKAQELTFIKSKFSLIEMWVEDLHHINRSVADLTSRELIAALAKNEARQESDSLLKVKATTSGLEIKSVRIITDETDTNGDFMDSLKQLKTGLMAPGDDGNDFELASIRNTCINMVPRFDSVMKEYRLRLDARIKYLSTRSEILFKFLAFGLLIWLIGVNLYFNNLFLDLKHSVDQLMAEGTRDSESLRLRHSLRAIQLLNGCTPGYSSPSCELVKNNTWTSYDLERAKKSLINSARAFRDANHQMLEQVMESTDQEYFDSVVNSLYKKTTIMELYRLNKREPVQSAIIQSLDLLAYQSQYLSEESELSTFQLDYNDVKPLPSSSNGLFHVENPSLWRAAFFIDANVRHIQDDFSGINEIYQELFEIRLNVTTKHFLVMSIVPVLVLIFCLSVFIIPDVKRMIDWQADILSTMLNIPRNIVSWWHSALITKLEEDAKEDQSITAEILMQLQNELGENTDEAMISKKPSKTGRGEDLKKDSPVNKTNVKTSMALHAINSSRLIVKFIVACALFIVIPLLSLITVPTLSESTSIASQMHYANLIVVKMYRTRFNLVEACLNHYSGDKDATQVHLERSERELHDFQDAQRVLIYGDLTRGIKGLTRNRKSQ